MNVRELVELLRQYPADEMVMILDSEWGAEPVHDVEYRRNRYVVISA